MKPIHILVLFVLFCNTETAITLIAPFFLAYEGFFPYKEVISAYNLPQFLYSMANFDGAHYILIAEKGGYFEYQQAFFPLYPILIFLLTPLVMGNYLVAGLTISHLAFLIALFILNEYLKLLKVPKTQILWFFIFLLVFPTSYYFRALYTESLFFLLFILSLYLYEKKQYVLASVASAFTSFTRLVGIFLVAPFLTSALSRYGMVEKKTKKATTFSWKEMQNLPQSMLRTLGESVKAKKIPVSVYISLIAPLGGLALYMQYLAHDTGDPLAFVHVQSVFDANRSTDSLVLLPQVLFRYMKIFFTAQVNHQYINAAIEFIVFNTALVILTLDGIKHAKTIASKVSMKYLGIWLFSVINLILPTLTGTLSSTPRYALMSIAIFFFLSQVSHKWIKVTIAWLFFLLHVIMLSFFIQGYFVG